MYNQVDIDRFLDNFSEDKFRTEFETFCSEKGLERPKSTFKIQKVTITFFSLFVEVLRLGVFEKVDKTRSWAAVSRCVLKTEELSSRTGSRTKQLYIDRLISFEAHVVRRMCA